MITKHIERRIDRIRVISFDLDDTLIATEKSVVSRVGHALRRYEIFRGSRFSIREAGDLIHRVASTDPALGTRFGVICSFLGIENDEEAIQHVKAGYYDSLFEIGTLTPYAYEVIHRLASKFIVGVISNGPAELQRRKLSTFCGDLPLQFSLVSGELEYAKPDPRIFLDASCLTGAQIDQIAHVGDSLFSDVHGANEAGCLSIHLQNHGYPETETEQIEPHLKITSMRDLLSLFLDS